LLSSAIASLAIDPSGPGTPTFRAPAARRFVSRSTSASTHARITRSRRTGSPSPWSRHVASAHWIGAQPLPKLEPPIDTRSFINVVSATRQPSPTSPSRLASGTRASVK
jgi:hypothetical protein